MKFPQTGEPRFDCRAFRRRCRLVHGRRSSRLDRATVHNIAACRHAVLIGGEESLVERRGPACSSLEASGSSTERSTDRCTRTRVTQKGPGNCAESRTAGSARECTASCSTGR